MWLFGGVIYCIAIKYLWCVLQRKLFGDFMIIDVAKFVAPPFCATCFREATETRSAFFISTGAGQRWTPKLRPVAKLDFSRTAQCEKEQIDETKTQTV